MLQLCFFVNDLIGKSEIEIHGDEDEIQAWACNL